MAQLDWHNLNGYRFQETLLGPCVQRECVDCGATTHATPEYPTPRCQGCLHDFYWQSQRGAAMNGVHYG